jgi:hypothetical protein
MEFYSYDLAQATTNKPPKPDDSITSFDELMNIYYYLDTSSPITTSSTTTTTTIPTTTSSTPTTTNLRRRGRIRTTTRPRGRVRTTTNIRKWFEVDDGKLEKNRFIIQYIESLNYFMPMSAPNKKKHEFIMKTLTFD